MASVADNWLRDVCLRLRMRRNGTLPKARDLQAVPLFAACSWSELDKLVGLTTQLRARPGTVLCRAGDRRALFLILMAGRLEVTSDGRSAETWWPGSYIPASVTRLHTAEMPTVRAESEVEVIVMNRREFTTMIDLVPSVRAQLSGGQRREATWSRASAPGVIQAADIEPLQSHS